MKCLAGLICVGFVSALLVAATPKQIEAWKSRFPAAAVGDLFAVRQLSTQYEDVVRTITRENAETVVWGLREKAERDVLAAMEFAGRSGVTGAEAKAKIAWLQNRLLPYLNEKR